jgi:hypothetical protein
MGEKFVPDIKGGIGIRPRMFENKGLRRLFGPKRSEVTGGWRKLHNEEISIFCLPRSVIRLIKSSRTR